MHGILSDAYAVRGLEDRLQQRYPGRLVTRINAGLGEGRSLVDCVSQVKDLIRYLKNATEGNPAYSNGYHLIGHSQGALLLRGLISMWDEHKVHTFISLAGPHQGITGTDMGLIDWMCRNMPKGLEWTCPLFRFLAKHAELTIWGPQSYLLQKISGANYVKIMSMYDEYLSNSGFLCFLNNECSGTLDAPWDGRHIWNKGCRGDSCYNQNPRYQENFARLEKAAFLVSPDDGTIEPWQSGLFDFLDADGKVVDFMDTPLGLHELVPLAEMGNRVLRLAVSDVLHHEWQDGKGFENYSFLLDE